MTNTTAALLAAAERRRAREALIIPIDTTNAPITRRRNRSRGARRTAHHGVGIASDQRGLIMNRREN